MELNPSLTTTYTDFVLSALLPMGRNIESVQQLEAARRVDPLSLDVRRMLVHVLVNVGRHADAIESARWVLAGDPKFPYAEMFLGRALLFAGRPKEALAMFENGKSEGNWGYIGYLYAVTGRRAEAEALAAQPSRRRCPADDDLRRSGRQEPRIRGARANGTGELVACRHVDGPAGNVILRDDRRSRASRQTRAAPIRRPTVATAT